MSQFRGIDFSYRKPASRYALKPLDLAAVRFYGRISYSFYLFHPIGLALASRTIGAAGLSPSIAVATIFLLTLIYTTPMAWLSWRAVEKPFMRLGRSKYPNDVIANDSRLHDHMSITGAGVIYSDVGEG